MRSDEFVTSDIHFGHRAMITKVGRPFETVEEMNEALIERWNNKVPKTARVYVLGDFSFLKKAETEAVLDRLHGRICLVRGNHDKNRIDGPITKRFEWVKDYYESKTDDGRKVVMSHYAMVVWNKSHFGSWMLHGHSHGYLKDDTRIRRLDVGVDTHPNLEPYSFEEIKQRMESRGIVAFDQHQPQE